MKSRYKCFRTIFFAALISLSGLFVSCSTESGADFVPERIEKFTVYDFNLDEAYEIYAELLYERNHCLVWAEIGSGIDTRTAREIATTYDNDILGALLRGFGLDNIQGKGSIMQIASEIVYGHPNGKLDILLFDIKDWWDPNNPQFGYIYGFFNDEDFFSKETFPDSNERLIIYMDSNPGGPDDPEFYDTIAHELQHLMNFTASIEFRNSNEMDIWINEGLSAAAEWIYTRQYLQRRIDRYNLDPAGSIAQGNNFFVWDERNDSDYLGDEYATVYLFFQWLRLQAGTSRIFGDIITSPYMDQRAVTTAFHKHATAKGLDQWDTMLKSWLAANHINAPSGIYGYLNEPRLNTIKTIPTSETGLRLYPGEGVYSMTNSSNQWPATGQTGGQSMRYAGLQKSPPELNETEVFTSDGSVLMSYNINNIVEYDDNYNVLTQPELAYTTGLPVPAAARAAASLSNLSGPERIDARDILRQRGRNK